ncbi:MAG TPA: bifunctional nicotinamidase/pyrazinamidase [Caulobacteraceae bacterium]|jgi:nicotinamidase/pyrazinamidase|nr:bifunctional nicotinamidase/pyrazinamidase [Caulobacteraceae bacterium]
MSDPVQLSDTDVLLAVDVQNDFCAGGALAVPDGDEVVPIIGALAQRFAHVVLTQDWHPRGHQSFASAHPGRAPMETIEAPYGHQVLWPDHCVQETPGAAFHPDLGVGRAELVLRKGYRPEIDSYSAFFENDHTTPTGLGGYLRERGFRRVFLAGLAFDFCVLWSAKDAQALGFEALVIEDACRAINADGSEAAARRELDGLGVRRLSAKMIG